MTTATWSSRLRHDSDAVYQEWRDELITKLGLMVTGTYLAADETNITPGAGARPGTNTEQGYAVYHLADSVHGTSPVYIRFGFGTGSGTTTPRLQITYGTSTNGSGVIGGTCKTTIFTVNQWSAETTDTARTSYLCVVPGFLGLQHKIHGSGGDGLTAVARTVDNTGAITSTGAVYVVSLNANGANSACSVQHARFISTAVIKPATTAAANATSTQIGFFPSAPPGTTSGSSVQAAVCWAMTPLVTPLLHILGVMDAEVSVGTSFTCTPVGSSSHTYIGLGVIGTAIGPSAATTGTTDPGYPKAAMIWE